MPNLESLFTDYMQQGRRMMEQGRYEEALTFLERARRIQPDDVRLLNLLGTVYFKLNRLDEAEQIYEVLVRKNPNVAILHSNLGMIRLKKRDWDGAEVAFLRVLQLDPEHKKAYGYLGLIAEQRGELEQALDYYQKAGVQAPIQRVQAKLRERQQAEAEAPLEQADIVRVEPLEGRPAPETGPVATPEPSLSETAPGAKPRTELEETLPGTPEEVQPAEPTAPPPPAETAPTGAALMQETIMIPPGAESPSAAPPSVPEPGSAPSPAEAWREEREPRAEGQETQVEVDLSTTQASADRYLTPTQYGTAPEPESHETASEMAAMPAVATPAEESPAPPVEESASEAAEHLAAMAEPAETESAPAVEPAARVETPAPSPIVQSERFVESLPIRPVNLGIYAREQLYVYAPVGSERFLLLEPHLLEIVISDRVIFREGALVGYSGELEFTDMELTPGLPVIQAKGYGLMFLAYERRSIHLISLNEETIYISMPCFLVAQATLHLEPQVITQSNNRMFSYLKVSGTGTVGFVIRTKPLVLKVLRHMPAVVHSDAVIAWSGSLRVIPVEDPRTRALLRSYSEDAIPVRFEGVGDLIAEQGALWGDRRTLPFMR